MKFVTYSRESGFRVIEAVDEQEAEMLSGDGICLDSLDNMNSIIEKNVGGLE